jgi:transcriptional regulator of arginine metabolism
MASTDAKDRIQHLRSLLEEERASTQDEIREELKRLDFEVNQSTISRDLRRLGAIKMTDGEGRTIYRLASEAPPAFVKSLADLVRSIQHNGAMIVVRTDKGSASLVALHIDALRTDEILGTIAGDDTVFVAPVSTKKIEFLVRQIELSLESSRQ